MPKPKIPESGVLLVAGAQNSYQVNTQGSSLYFADQTLRRWRFHLGGF